MEQRPKTVLALGFFDGIHIGHAALLNAAKARAAALGAEPAVLTFDLHPDIFVKKTPVPLLCSPADRAYIIRRFFGIERTYCIHFNEHTMHMPWREFLDGVCAEYNAVGFVVGYDFRFGDRGEGDGEKLASYCAARGLGCDIIPAVTLDGAAVSLAAYNIDGSNYFRLRDIAAALDFAVTWDNEAKTIGIDTAAGYTE